MTEELMESRKQGFLREFNELLESYSGEVEITDDRAPYGMQLPLCTVTLWNEGQTELIEFSIDEQPTNQNKETAQ